MENLELFRQIIDADLNRLHLIAGLLDEVTRERALREPFLVYAAVIKRFWRGEIEWLRATVSVLESCKGEGTETSHLTLATRLRLQCLTHEFVTEDLKRAELLSSSESPWSAEFCMLVAAAYEYRGEIAKAQAWYQTAVVALDRIGARRKSVRARLNAVTLESHLDGSRNLIPRYHDVFRLAMKREIRELTVAGICLLNISHDYQKLGATLISLKYCQRSLTLLEHEYGTLPYYIAVTHRCGLYLDLGRFAEARVDYEQARAAPFPEIANALKLLEHAFEVDTIRGLTLDPSRIQSSWKDRKTLWIAQGGPETPTKLSKLEQKLVQLLGNGPMERHDLIDRLYGDRLELPVRMNRFQSLLSTLRKKSPGIVVYEGERYRLADPLFPALGTGAESA